MDLEDLQIKAHRIAKSKGFYDDFDFEDKYEPKQVGLKLALIHSEISEALEARRKGKIAINNFIVNLWYKLESKNERQENFISDYEILIKGSVQEELADAVIRIFDLAGALDFDLGKVIELKMNYNSTRPQKHGKNF